MNSDERQNGYQSPFRSDDCIDIIVDGPGDTTVRPLTGERLKQAKAEWEKIQQWRAAHPGQDFPEEIDIVVDGPGDTTVRPLTGELLKQAQAERAKILYWEAVQRGEIDPEKTPPPPPYQPPARG